MKNAIKFYSLMLALATLAACSDGKPKWRIGVSQCSNDAWRTSMNEEMAREASFHSEGVALDIRSAASDSRRQVAQIDSLVDVEKVDLLIVSPNEAEAVTPAVKRAYDKGIPVVVCDRKILSESYTAYVGADNRAIGRDAAAYVSHELEEGGVVAEFTGGMGATAAQERHEGFSKELSKNSNIKLLPPLGSDWEGTNAPELLDSLFEEGIVPDIIFACNDRTGVKIRQAALKRGKDIKVIGVDGLTTPGGGLQCVEKGELAASFVYPTGGYAVMRTAIAILNGKKMPRTTLLNTAVITPATARLFRLQQQQVEDREEQINLLDGQVDRVLAQVGTQKMLLIACIVIILLIGLIMAAGLRVYHATMRRNAVLAEQKKQLEEQTAQLAAQTKKLELQRDQLVSLAKELEETTQSKLTFFTEVSHDLRTPLTLILAPVEQLREGGGLSEKQQELLNIVQTNANVLLRLVNQTLDFRKFEAGQLRLSLTRCDLSECFKKWCEPFKSLAQRNMVRYTILPPEATAGSSAPMGCIDAQKLESIMYNLLSNAFKYTPEGGRVEAHATLLDDEEQGRRLTLTVSDTGQGIPKEKIGHIFERFYQVEPGHEGTGIGLTTVKAYAELHGGTAGAACDAVHGTVFTVTLPCIDNLQEAQALLGNKVKEEAAAPATPFPAEIAETPVEDFPKKEKNTEAEKTSSATTPEAEEGTAQKPRVLIIDDNADIRTYIRLMLGDAYEVAEASDGKQGLALARKLMPDAVVCDVMMPVMDGWECCRRMKDEWQTSHIPVMLLTACTHDEQRIEGFDCGADSYLSKPFSPDVFRARLRNLINNRQRLKAFFSDQTTALAQPDVSELDKGFVERFRQLIEERMGDAELGVEELAAAMGLGRSQLYRKVKQLTGFSPVELLRISRLKRAASLLRRTEKNVGEVAYEVGFNSPGYLTKCFHEYFGQSPTDYAKG